MTRRSTRETRCDRETRAHSKESATHRARRRLDSHDSLLRGQLFVHRLHDAADDRASEIELHGDAFGTTCTFSPTPGTRPARCQLQILVVPHRVQITHGLGRAVRSRIGVPSSETFLQRDERASAAPERAPRAAMLYVAACSSPLDNSAGFARSRFVPPPGSPNARSNSASAPSASPAAKRSRPFSMAYEASLSSTHDLPTSFPARGVDVDGLETRARARCARVSVEGAREGGPRGRR